MCGFLIYAVDAAGHRRFPSGLSTSPKGGTKTVVVADSKPGEDPIARLVEPTLHRDAAPYLQTFVVRGRVDERPPAEHRARRNPGSKPRPDFRRRRRIDTRATPLH